MSQLRAHIFFSNIYYSRGLIALQIMREYPEIKRKMYNCTTLVMLEHGRSVASASAQSDVLSVSETLEPAGDLVNLQ